MISWTTNEHFLLTHARLRCGTLLTHIALTLFQINDMRVTESGHLEYFLEYVDYPEEGKHILC